ncbi:MAG: hypothetical protein K0R10_1002 [Alphaproteobacteria bacterium]|jgi:uncharacterized membrane protein YtjA (UPF0391 family)|nr:hypothetical protein [Alphaproteobacteria bacterium]
MLRYAIIFLILALVAAVFGFGGVAAVSMDIARLLVMVFLVLFIVTLAFHALRGKAPPV